MSYGGNILVQAEGTAAEPQESGKVYGHVFNVAKQLLKPVIA